MSIVQDSTVVETNKLAPINIIVSVDFRKLLNSQRYDESRGGVNNTYKEPIIHNGDMNISQRGDLTGVNSAQYISADRFFINMENLEHLHLQLQLIRQVLDLVKV